MSNLNSGLTLNMKLDTLGTNGVISDLSGNGHNGTIQGSPKVVNDPTFGPCLDFNGSSDYILLQMASALGFDNASFTVVAWVNPVGLVDKFDIDGDRPVVGGSSNFQLLIRGRQPYFGFDNNDSYSDSKLNDNTWYQMVWRYNKQARTQDIFVQGRNVNSSSGHRPFTENDIIFIGFWMWSDEPQNSRFFKGKIANVRIYNRPLANVDIAQLYANEKGGTITSSTGNTQPAPYYKAHPVGLELLDADGSPTIYINDNPQGPNAQLYVNLSNAWTKPIYLKPTPNGTASKQTHHFALRFKRGLLSANTLTKVVLAAKGDGAEWSITKAIPESSWDVVYFLRKAAVSGTDWWKFDLTKKVALTLENVSASGVGGSRGSHAQLQTNVTHVAYDNKGLQGIQESSSYHLNLVNHRGKKHIPLHVGFIGATANMVLNDGTAENSLTLRITNTSDQPLALTKANNPQFSLSFLADDAQSDAWTLTDSTKTGVIKAKVKSSKGASGEIGDSAANQAKTTSYKINHTTAGPGFPDSLAKFGTAGDSIDIVLSTIVTAHPAGLANLYVHYENIPGYWDGQFVCPIQKTPLVYYHDVSSNLGRVGIGIATPSQALQVGDNAIIGHGPSHTNLWWGPPQDHGGKGLSNIYPAALMITKKDASSSTLQAAQPWIDLHNDDETEGNGAMLTFSSNSKGANYIGGAIQGIFKGKVAQAMSGELALWTVDTNAAYERIRIDSNGNVGIGIPTPKSKLAIAGNAIIGTSYSTTAAPANGLLVEGNVGIGTPTADHPLHIKSGAYGLHHTDGKSDVSTWVGKSGDVTGGWVGTKNNNPLVLFTNNSRAQVVLKTSGDLQLTNGNLTISQKRFLDFGIGITKQQDAGRIGYQTWSGDALDIVGAGTTGTDRKIQLYAEGGLSIRGPIRGPIVSGYIPRSTSFDPKKSASGSGDGYKWEFKGDGCYDVTFTPAFKSAPIVIANITWENRSGVYSKEFDDTNRGQNDTRDNVIILKRSDSKVRFMTGDDDGDRYDDLGILFTAIGTIA